MTETTSGPAGRKGKGNRKGIRVRRVFTTPGTHPYDSLEWERRDVVMTNWRDGTVNFEQRGVEFPSSWSMNATQIVTSKYFRGAVGTPEREWSLKQLIDRVVGVYTETGREHGYFASAEDAEVFDHELKHALAHQLFSFNSPVWFNVGTNSKAQVSACQPYDAMVSTPAGLVPIGELVERDAVGTKVYDAHGLTRVVATKANGVKDVLRLHTKAGYTLDVTPDHLVWRSTGTELDRGRFLPAAQLQPGDKVQWHRREAFGESEIRSADIAEAALAGWLQSDGFVGQYNGTNRSLTIEAMTVTPAELEWVTSALDTVLPGIHRKETRVSTQDETLDCRRTRLYGNGLADFVERWGLRTRGTDMEVPAFLFTAPLPVVRGYLRSVFQAEGYVSDRERSTLIGLDMISEKLIRGVQRLLLRFGIFSRVRRRAEPREDRHDIWALGIQPLGERELFHTEIGFVDERKTLKLERSLDRPGRAAGRTKCLEIARVENLGAMDVYDIQTESGEYLSGNLRVHNCFILSVDDTMESILDWYKEEGIIFKGGSGAGVNLSRIRSSRELLSSGGTASGPVSFMRGADASAGTIKSGGATRRAAKMVVLDVDHPDIEDFVETKAREEHKIRALRDAGFDVDLGGDDMFSVQYQNANNSVRVSDAFMRAVESGSDFGLTSRTTGEVVATVDAKELFQRMARAAWECADPGIQYDGTIQDWHTTPESGRISASNPCFPADQRVLTDRGHIPIGDLIKRAARGETFAVYTNDITAETDAQNAVVATIPTQYMVTGTNEILELRFSDGSLLRCTPNHRLWTENRGWVHAEKLLSDDRVVRSFQYAPRSNPALRIPRAALEAVRTVAALPSVRPLYLPEKWDEDPDLAHYLGWLVGDGSVGDQAVVTVYGTAEEQQNVLPRHQALIERLTGHRSKPSLQPNGTQQLRITRRTMVEFVRALGLGARAEDKSVPPSLFEAPEETVLEFLQGLFDADGCAVDQKANGTRYIGLGSRSEQLLRDVQELLAPFGIASRVYRTSEGKPGSFSYTRKDGSTVTYGSDGPFFDLRISAQSMQEFSALVNFSLEGKSEKLREALDFRRMYRTRTTTRLFSRRSAGFETTYNLTEPRNHSYIVGGTVVANCSEYMSLDDSSCNLASINLLKFLREDDTFDVERFTALTELVITAMDVSITFADFPTEKIGETTRAYRQLGIGYANLGALLMATGHAYDSEGGRAVAAAVTSLMTGTAYRRSAELAGVVGPYDGYRRNERAHKRVMRKHAAANDDLRTVGTLEEPIHAAATREWAECLRIGERNGWRNAQASLLAPTGTIGFMMDCDTTGIEPDFSLVKFKKLVGGGSMQIVNQAIPRALGNLGYQDEQIEAVVEYVSENGHVVDAPGLRTEHYEVFDCAMGLRYIRPMGHVRMMAAVQPFLSGAISKTVNVPEEASVEDFEHIYFEGWRMGLKALAVYRDNCKVGQPLSTGGTREKEAGSEAEAVEAPRPVRRRLPKKRPSETTSFSVGGAEGYITAGSYPDDGLGEVFMKLGKQGSTLAGVMDAFSIAISIALQYGVPLETYVEKFTNMRFDPAGMTDDPDIRMAQSVVDYIFRRLALDHLPYEERAALGVLSAAERQAQVAGEDPAQVATQVESYAQSAATRGADAPEEVPAASAREPHAAAERPTRAHSTAELMEGKGFVADAPLCVTCGTKMRPSGSCYACEGCGATSGCS
ncbi:vitamin B12-dependent ribonucleotide reductase [Nocardiopsis dassonvillei]|uniref:vitamin B12-dependent ribonucleotide reductase n=1 Tax=Nocardiopsis dassonvillei TaxID=2014 RepID=UPI003672FE23